MDNFDVKFEETLSAFNVHPSETDNSFNTEGDSVIVIPQGGECKIQSISVNGEEQPIVNKNVNIIVPTKTSDLENDSDFATTNDIPTKVSDLDNDSKFVNEETLEKAKEELKKYADENDQVGDENIIASVSVNGKPQTITDKNVNIIIPENTGGTIDDFVKVTKTVNSLSKGDTLFKGDTIKFNIDSNELRNYFTQYTPKITYLYFVNKETNDGFRFDCYIKQLNVLQYNITIQIHYLENENINLIHEESATVSLLNFGNLTTNYSLVNTYKDITNLYIYYTSSETTLSGKHEGLIGGITAQRISTVQDTLLNSKDGVETPIDGYVKVKLNSETNLPSRLVQIVGNKEKEIPINEEIDKKLGEIENKVNSSHVVDIKQFIFEGNTWIHEKTLKHTIISSEDKSSYIARSAANDDLYYYTYRDIKTNVGFNIANSSFEKKTIDGKELYTSSEQSYNRDATALQLDKRPLDISSVSFDLYMTGLGYASSTGKNNRYYPEIAFIDEERNISFEAQFSAYDKGFQLKVIRKHNGETKDPRTIGSLPIDTSNSFYKKIKITIKDSVFSAYYTNTGDDNYILIGSKNIDVGDKGLELCPEIDNLSDITKITFGLRYDKTPPTDWGGFSNVVFEKKYWEQGYKIQDNTLYVNLEDNTLYRYVEDSTTKPYPNFIGLTNQGGSSSNSISYLYYGHADEYDSECILVTDNPYIFEKGKNYKIQSTAKTNEGEDILLTLNIKDYNDENTYEKSIILGIDATYDRDYYRRFIISLSGGNLTVKYTTDYYFNDGFFSSTVTIQEI